MGMIIKDLLLNNDKELVEDNLVGIKMRINNNKYYHQQKEDH
jgi:hypothetical protein